MKKEYRSVERTKKSIKAAFVELLGEKKNMDNITASELAHRANIAKSTFYNHYDDVYSVAAEFENELISELSSTLDEIEAKNSTEYDEYIGKIFDFLRENENIYKIAMATPDARFVVEKLKSIISKKMFEHSKTLPFSKNKSERYVQIRILTNACADTIADYFRGILPVTLDEVESIIMDFFAQLRK